MKKRAFIKLPMIMGLIGGLVGVPFSAQIAKAAVSVSNLGSEIAQTGGVFSLIMLIGAAIGILCALLSQSYPVPCGLGFIISAALVGVSLKAFHWTSLVILLLFFLAAVGCFLRRKDAILQLIHLLSKKGKESAGKNMKNIKVEE